MTGKFSNIFLSFVLILSILFAFCACGDEKDQTEPLVLGQSAKESEKQSSSSPSTSESSFTHRETQKADTYIILNNSNTTINGSGASFSQGVLKIEKGGSYNIKGSLSNGQISVDAPKGQKVTLILFGVDIYCTNAAPIHVKGKNSKVNIVLSDGSINSLSDSSSRRNEESSDASACIYSDGSLELSGNGTLKINARFSKGIFCKTELKLCGGTYAITSKDDAIRAKDSITISDSTVEAVCGGDAVRTNAESEKEGDILLSSSTLNLTSDLDSVRSSGNIKIEDSSLTALSGGGSLAGKPSSVKHSFGLGSDGESSLSDSSLSRKGLRAEGKIEISSGTFKVNSADNAFKSDDELKISSGSFFIKSGDTALCSAKSVEISSGNIMITESQNGVTGRKIKIGGGLLSVRSSKIGLCAQTGNGSAIKKSISNRYNPDCLISITSGIVSVCSDKDAVLSCGSIKQSGGSLIAVSGSSVSSRAVGSLGKFKQSGGKFLALGNSSFSSKISCENSKLQFALSVGANENVTITDKSANAVVSFVSPKSFTKVFYSDKSLKSGEEYSVLCQTMIPGSSIGGIYDTLSFSGGNLSGTFKASR